MHTQCVLIKPRQHTSNLIQYDTNTCTHTMNKYMISLSVPVIYNMIDFIGKFSYKVMKTATHYLFTNIVDLLLV